LSFKDFLASTTLFEFSYTQTDSTIMPYGTAHKTSIVIESISRSSSLVKLSLINVVFGEHCPLEGFLSFTRTLLDFYYSQDYSTMTYATAQAIGRGFAQNKSLAKLTWSTSSGLDFMEEVLFGWIDHNKLKSLELELSLTKSSSQVLRSLLHCNETLECFNLILHETEEVFPAIASVLAGLAQNKGLKEVQIQSESSETDTILAAAWTDMGQEMLKKNNSLKTLSLDNSIISLEGFECLARGLSCNASLRLSICYVQEWRT
jgi:hypothetical protein